MSAYIKQLEMEASAERESRREEKERAAAQVAHERLAPLEQRLTRLLAEISVDEQVAGLSLPVLQASLRGRRKGNCHPGELGRALRKMGFKRERRWNSRLGFQAIWRRQV